MRYADMLAGMPQFSIDKIERGEGGFCAFVHVDDTELMCPNCQSGRMGRFGHRVRAVRDVPYRKQPVTLMLSVRRLLCRDCGVTFMEAMPGVDDSRRMTARLIDYIWSKGLTQTFTSIAAEIGVVEATVRIVFEARLRQLGASQNVKAPKVMALTRIALSGQTRVDRAVITSVLDGTIVGLADRFDGKSIAAEIKGLQERERVESVFGPMDRSLMSACRSVLPGARYCVDRDSIDRLWDEALFAFKDEIKGSVGRRHRVEIGRLVLNKAWQELGDAEREAIIYWGASIPLIKQVSDARTMFERVLRAKGHARAQVLLDEWLASYGKTLKRPLAGVIKGLNQWRDEFLASFDVRAPGQHFEALERFKSACLRCSDSMGWRGYSFDVFRALVMHAKGRMKGKPGALVGVELTSLDW